MFHITGADDIRGRPRADIQHNGVHRPLETAPGQGLGGPLQ